jgi:hypothetical protein
MYSLPGGFTADAALRKCVADFLWYYPAILANPMKCLHQFREQNKGKVQSHEGDLNKYSNSTSTIGQSYST